MELSFSGSAQFSKTHVVSILKTTSTICFIIKDITISQKVGEYFGQLFHFRNVLIELSLQ